MWAGKAYMNFMRLVVCGGRRAQGARLADLGPEAEDILTVFLDRARAFDQTQNGDLLGFKRERASTEDLKQ